MTDPSGPPTRRTVLAGRYELDGVLGHGGMADVYHGTDKVLGRQVAVKVLGRHFARDGSFVARFRREAQAAAALNHPNVVSVFDTGSDDGTHYIVMEYLQGTTLGQVIQEEAPLSAERAADIVLAVARGLAFAHRAGIVHRDVKPGNIMLAPGGEVKVMDFGIARATTGESLTQTATVLGTATYFSPEQAQGESVDARSDIYALGCVMYEMLTGHPPFSGENAVAVAYKHVREEATPPGRARAGIPPDLEAIVMRCLAKDPADRYQTAEDLVADLQRFRSGMTVEVTALLPFAPTKVMRRPVGPSSPTGGDERRRRIAIAAIIAGILVVLGVGLFLLAKSLAGSTPTAITVTDVRGKTVAVAKQILALQGFTDVTTTEVPSSQPAETVLDYNPKTAVPGSTINLSVSSGPQQVSVPNVVCETRRDAIDQLKALGLKYTIGPPSQNAVCPQKGVVGAQDPAPLTTVDTGSTVTLFLVPAPSPSPSPIPSPPPSPSPSPSASPSPTPPGPSPSPS